MGSRTSALCLTLVAALSAAGATASAAGAGSKAGEVNFTLSPRELSTLPIDIGALVESQCDDSFPSPGNLGQCRLTVGIGGPKPIAVDSSCGYWDVSLRLDDTVEPISVVILRSPPNGSGGSFSFLEIRARLRAIHQSMGREINESITFGINLTDPWLLPSPNIADIEGGLPAILEDFLLAAGGPQEKCLPLWLLSSSQALNPYAAGECRICLP